MGQKLFFGPTGDYLGSVESDVLDEDCEHRDTVDVGSCSSGCCDRLRCLDCGDTFLVEVPD